MMFILTGESRRRREGDREIVGIMEIKKKLLIPSPLSPLDPHIPLSASQRLGGSL
jgi:hypothetical protein